MQLQNINIFSTGGFIFFLLIILVGYLWVEIIFGKDYIFRKIFERYNNSLFDRIIHYIFWGFIINFIIILFFSYTSGQEYFKIIDIAGKIASTFEPIVGKEKTLDVQFILISFYQFILIFLIGFTIQMFKWGINMFKFFFFRNRKIKKKTFLQKLIKKFKKGF